MARLQFRHSNKLFDNRELAYEYLKKIVNSEGLNANNQINAEFGGESLIGEPLVVKYSGETKPNVLLAIGIEGELGESAHTEYFIIDSAKYEEDIKNLFSLIDEISGLTEEIKQELTDEIERATNAESGLSQDIQELQETVSGIQFEKIEVPSEENVKEAYRLIDGNGQQMGDTIIKIYKDSAYKEIYLGTSADTVNTATGEITKLDGDKESLNYVYMKADGTYEMVKVDLEDFLTESEFGDGLDVDGHLVSVKIDPASEEFLTVGPNGVKISGIKDAISSATNDVQSELDRTQVGAGLAEDGTYKKHDRQGESNYIYEADSLDEADLVLDSTLKTVENKVDNLSASTESFISETNNKISEIESEINELSAATANETHEREEADAILTEVVSNVIEKENHIESALTQEIADRQAADAALSDRIDEIEDNIVVGENAIDVTVADDTAKVTLKISAADNVLTQDTNGLKTNLSVAIVREDDVEYIVLRGKNDVELSRVNANKFVKDGMLDRAYLDNNNLILIFNTDSGKEPIVIPLSDLIPVYQAGTYLTLENNVFDARVGQGGLATNESVAILSGRVEDKIAQLDGTYLQPGSIRNIINTTFSDPLTHTPVGTQEDADNNNLMRYYHPEGGADGDVRYYVSNKTTDMTHDGENLGDVINNMLEIISGIGDDIEERLENLESGLTQEIIDRENGDNALWEALSAETEARNSKERVIASALNDLNNKIINFSGAVLDNFNTKEESDNKYMLKSKEEVIAKALNTLNEKIDEVAEEAGSSEALIGLSGVVVHNSEDITNLYEIAEELSGKTVDLSGYYTSAQTDELFVTKEEYEIDEKVIAAAFNDLNERLLNTPLKDDVYTKEEVDELINNMLGNVYTALKSILQGTNREIKVTTDDANNKITIGFDDDAIFGNSGN